VTAPARAAFAESAVLPPPAGLARRLGAALYEALLLTAIEFLVGLVTLPIVAPSAHGSATALAVPGQAARAFLFVVLVLVGGIYLIHGWTAGRRTLPQKTWHLRLVDASGGPLSLRSALARYLAGFIGPLLGLVAYVALQTRGLGAFASLLTALNFLWALIDRDRLFLHDRVAGTRLVLDR